jgi:hypothetical protein
VVAATAAVLGSAAAELAGHHQQHVVAKTCRFDSGEECIDAVGKVFQQTGLFSQLVGVRVEPASADHDQLRTGVGRQQLRCDREAIDDCRSTFTRW